MAIFNFLNDVKIYIEYSGTSYKLDVSTVSFGQTFTEKSYTVDTLHVRNLFEASVINSANPANFSFDYYLTTDGDTLGPLQNIMTNVEPFTLYIETSSSVYKIETALIESASFTLARNEFIKVSVSGTGSRLWKDESLPSNIASSTYTKKYLRPEGLLVKIDNVPKHNITSVAIELQNEISWAGHKTIQGALIAQNASSSMYPTTYTLSKQILAGNIQQYLTDENDQDLLDWSTSSNLIITAGETIDSFFVGLVLDFEISYTNRIQPGTVIKQSYDWRCTDNSKSTYAALYYSY